MLEKSPKLLDFSPKLSSGRRKVSAAVEAREIIIELAGPQEIGGRVKAALDLVSRKIGFAPRRVRAIYNSEARRIDAEELDQLRRARDLLRARKQEAINDEIAQLRERLARLEEQAASQRQAVGAGASQ